MSLVPTSVRTANVTANDDATVVAAPGLRLVGVDFVEEAAATFEFHIVEGATAAGTKKKSYKGASGAMGQQWFWPGLDFSGGISIDWVSGDITVILHTITTPEG